MGAGDGILGDFGGFFWDFARQHWGLISTGWAPQTDWQKVEEADE